MDESTYTQAVGEKADVQRFPWNEEDAFRQTEKRPCSFPHSLIELFTYPSGETIPIDENWRLSHAITDTSTALKILELTKDVVKIGIGIPKPVYVGEYLRGHGDMVDLVQEVCQITRACFPSTTQLTLEVYNDPEIEDEYLTLYVRQEDYERDILKKIKAILSGYGDRLADKSGWFLVTTDFEPPI